MQVGAEAVTLTLEDWVAETCPKLGEEIRTTLEVYVDPAERDGMWRVLMIQIRNEGTTLQNSRWGMTLLERTKRYREALEEIAEVKGHRIVSVKKLQQIAREALKDG